MASVPGVLDAPSCLPGAVSNAVSGLPATSNRPWPENGVLGACVKTRVQLAEAFAPFTPLFLDVLRLSTGDVQPFYAALSTLRLDFVASLRVVFGEKETKGARQLRRNFDDVPRLDVRPRTTDDTLMPSSRAYPSSLVV